MTQTRKSTTKSKAPTRLAFAAALMCSVAVQPAMAGSGDFLKGAAAGVAGTLIIQQLNKKKAQPRRTTKPKNVNRSKQSGTKSSTRRAYTQPAGPRATIATFPTTREEVRIYQSRLNALGFDAGTPDGITGKRTRAAVRAFQASIGVAVTGTLTQLDASVLLGQANQPFVTTASASQTGSTTYPLGTPIMNNGHLPATGQVAAAPAPTFPALPLANNSGGATSGQPLAMAPPAPAAPPFPQVTEAASAFAPTPNTAQTTQNPGFAAMLGTTTTAPQAQQNAAFPLVVDQAMQTVGAQPQATFPTISAPPANLVENPSPSNALTAVEDNSAQMQTAALAVQNAAPLAEPLLDANQFTILGIGIGGKLSDAQQVLTEEGFSNCERNGELLLCDTKKEGLHDRILIGASGGSPLEAEIYVLARHMTFTSPLSRDFLKGRMAENYGGLLDRPGHVSAPDSCQASILSMDADEGPVGSLIVNSAPETLNELATICSTYSGIRFIGEPGAATVNGATITLFSGKKMQDSGSLAINDDKMKNVLKF